MSLRGIRRDSHARSRPHAQFHVKARAATRGGKERFPTSKLPQDGSPLFRFSGESPTSLIFTRYFPTSKWGIVRPGGKPPGAFGLMMRGIDAGTMPHFARGWFPTWQVWTDSSPLRSGELSGSKYEVGNCPDGNFEVENAKGIFGICSLVPTRSGATRTCDVKSPAFFL